MRTLILLLLVLIALPAMAQDSAPSTSHRPTDLRRDVVDEPGPTLSGTVTPTPEMWFYTQENRRNDSPSQAVRRKAEARAVQRSGRIESLAWQGQSGGRPTFAPSGMEPSFRSYGAYSWRTAWYSGNMLFNPIAVTR